MKLNNKALKSLLANKDIKQSQLARLVNIPRNTISDYLSGTHQPKPARIRLIADALDVAVESITIEEPAPKPESLSPKRQVRFCPFCGESLENLFD